MWSHCMCLLESVWIVTFDRLEMNEWQTSKTLLKNYLRGMFFKKIILIWLMTFSRSLQEREDIIFLDSAQLRVHDYITLVTYLSNKSSKSSFRFVVVWLIFANGNLFCSGDGLWRTKYNQLILILIQLEKVLECPTIDVNVRPWKRGFIVTPYSIFTPFITTYLLQSYSHSHTLNLPAYPVADLGFGVLLLSA